MYVYTAEPFDEKVKQHRLHDEAAKLYEMLKSLDTYGTLRGLLEPVWPYWMHRVEKLRLIGRILRVGDDQVICLLDILDCRDRNYKEFRKDPRRFGQKALEPLLRDDELQNWLMQEKRSETETEHRVRQVDPLPAKLQPWLEPPGWGADTYAEDLVIYESEEWVMRFRSYDIANYWRTYYDILTDLVLMNLPGEIDRWSQDVNGWPGLRLASKDKCFVLFRRIDTAGDEHRRVLFLLAPFFKEFDEKPSSVEIERVVVAADPAYTLCNATTDPSSLQLGLDELAPLASRSYPYYVLEDDRSWLAIEREEGANLSLSTEEERILRSVSNPMPGSSALPVFINGRAGSGKSTMLFYLFADYCFRKWQRKLEGNPLFITYSEPLLDVAKDRVRRLLSSHHRFLAKRKQGRDMPSAESLLKQVDNFFQPFQKFLLDLLPEEERVRFSQQKYISFHRFKQLYRGEPLRKDASRRSGEHEKLVRERRMALRLVQAKHWSAELCWHVIRTFIKGYRLDGYMEPDDYLEVPRRERTIAEDTFTRIYKTIWTRWYKPITTQQGYWDDQDLIRTVLERCGDLPRYTAVVCDEAQDFTRLELQLLMRLSIFSGYDLRQQPVHGLPFAFAGDPFQTLNPTGFRWSSIRATFFDEVIRSLDPDGRLDLGMNYQDLTYNYRSTPPIVQVTNFVQLCRHVLFDLPELKPQKSWKKGDFPEPVKFILDDNIQPHQFCDNVESTNIILPCEKGQEASYIKKDDILSQLFPNIEQDPPTNVYSPIEAKGLEFKRVVLYKFGDACPEKVWDLVTQPTDYPVEFEYFFNKLYVAVTRAMERLFVVDTKKGDQRLWKYASSLAELQQIRNRAREPVAWERHVRLLTAGAPASVPEMREDNPESNAEALKRAGQIQGDRDLLRRAKTYWATVGKTRDAELCEALALNLEEKYYEAGKLFLKHGEKDPALDCFWAGSCWQEVKQLAGQMIGS